MAPLAAQERVVVPDAPPHARTAIGQPWENVAPAYRHAAKFPTWDMPSDAGRWPAEQRVATLQTVRQLLGDLPERPKPTDSDRFPASSTPGIGRHPMD